MMQSLSEMFVANQWMVALWLKSQEDAKIIPIINEEIRLHKEREQ